MSLAAFEIFRTTFWNIEPVAFNNYRKIVLQNAANGVQLGFQKPNRIQEFVSLPGALAKEGKMELIRRLRIQGVFDVKDAIPYVCKVISVSQATLYNYLRDLRNDDELEPIERLKVK